MFNQYNTAHALFVLHHLRLQTHTQNMLYLLFFHGSNGCTNAPWYYICTHVIWPLFFSNKHILPTEWTIPKLPLPFLRSVSSSDVSVGRVARLRATQSRDSVSIHNWDDRSIPPKLPDRLRDPLSLIQRAPGTRPAVSSRQPTST
jgi:hypothetical protein